MVRVTSCAQSATECTWPQSRKGHMKPSVRADTLGKLMFSLLKRSGMQYCEHNELPQGSVTGARRGNEHCWHCNSRTMLRASIGIDSGSAMATGFSGWSGRSSEAGERGEWVNGDEANPAATSTTGEVSMGCWRCGFDLMSSETAEECTEADELMLEEGGLGLYEVRPCTKRARGLCWPPETEPGVSAPDGTHVQA